ncbi:hypothetical protein RV03_GL000561 [Enterococcus gallinarum]|nr:hypothetical protein RV03_GL000561 [Enterococcus gallinarum]
MIPSETVKVITYSLGMILAVSFISFKEKPFFSDNQKKFLIFS